MCYYFVAEEKRMKIIGREEELNTLNRLLETNRSEFVCLYGRRRVGKTFLIKKFFNEQFSFYTTGIKNLSNRSQLTNFKKQIEKYGLRIKNPITCWIDAFDALIELLSLDTIIKPFNKRVIFIDEAPWMDSPRNDFKAGLDYFWNTWASSKDDVILIVCGSATSWIINNLLKDTGGFYNRITKRIKLNPFTISEVKELLKLNGINYSYKEMIETYMVFGGIPYYLNLLDSRLSLAENIEELLFKETGELKTEKSMLFASLFNHYHNHEKIISALYNKKSGLSRKEIKEATKISNAHQLSLALEELEQCGFIRSFVDYKTKKNNKLYQIIDPFILFSFDVLENGNISSWLNFINTPRYYSWRGYAFETFCLNHIYDIKTHLGIQGVVTNEYSFINRDQDKNTQIDLIIDRKDNVVNICEMKYSDDLYEIKADYEDKLIKKIDIFKDKTKIKKTIVLTMITMYGLVNNSHSHIVNRDIKIVDWLK